MNSKSKGILTSIKKEKYLLIMLIPVLVYYALFFFRPFKGLVIAFQNYKPYLGIENSEWVGFENFRTFFNGPYFGRLMRNTLALSFLNLIFSFPISIILALLFNEIKNNKRRAIIQSITYLPRFISIVVVAGLLINFLSPSTGIINVLIEKLGGDRTYFLSRPEYFRAIYVFACVWTGAGFGSIIYYSTLCGINSELYEAVEIDGGGRLRKMLHVSMPGLKSTIAVMLIMQIGNILNVGYELIVLIYQPVTFEVGDVISTYVYRLGFGSGNYGVATAVGLFNGIVSLILVGISNVISRKIGDVGIF